MFKGFIPTTKEEVKKKGWKKLDIIIVTGDAYIDHNYFLLARISRLLVENGFKTGIIDQADPDDQTSLQKLGSPQLLFLVLGGEQDSMYANYTAFHKFKSSDPFTEGGVKQKRPDRALIKYTNRLKEFFKGNDKPVILAGLEASLRRFVHYDFKTNKLRKPVIFDAKADLLIHGQAEIPLLKVAQMLRNKGRKIQDVLGFQGVTYITKEYPEEGGYELSDFELVSQNKEEFAHYQRDISIYAKPEYDASLIQKIDSRYLVSNPPYKTYDEEEMSAIYDLSFTGKPHHKYQKEIPFYKYVKDIVMTHQGSFSGESFSYDHLYTGRDLSQRSFKSILDEIFKLVRSKDFKQIIRHFGGPVANMYGSEVSQKNLRKQYEYPSYLFPNYYQHLKQNIPRIQELFKRADDIKGFKNNFIFHKIDWRIYKKYPELQKDFIKNRAGNKVLFSVGTLNKEISRAHFIGEPDEFFEYLAEFKKRLGEYRKKKIEITVEIIGGLPGESLKTAVETALKLKEAEVNVQVVPYYPLPGTNASCIYYTGIEPYSGKKVEVSPSLKLKEDICTIYKFQKKGFKGKIIAILKKNGLENFLELIS